METFSLKVSLLLLVAVATHYASGNSCDGKENGTSCQYGQNGNGTCQLLGPYDDGHMVITCVEGFPETTTAPVGCVSKPVDEFFAPTPVPCNEYTTYSKNANVRTGYYAPKDNVVEVQLTDVDVEFDGEQESNLTNNCNKDYILLKSASGEAGVKLCGKFESYTYLPTTRDAIVQFISDGQYERRGFRASVRYCPVGSA